MKHVLGVVRSRGGPSFFTEWQQGTMAQDMELGRQQLIARGVLREVLQNIGVQQQAASEAKEGSTVGASCQLQ